MFVGPRRILALGILAALVPIFTEQAAAQVQAPIPGQNVNMVSGTQWPGGDPFLQRQNEPSVAVSSRNPLHLLAGANDYRTVDLNFFATRETGDAWLGVFKSFDGGATWQSTLLPGYPLDQTPEGLSSPLKTPMQFQAASDPVVRAGTNGLFFYSGIAFNRDQNRGVVFVSRYIDLNNKENGTATTTTISSNADPIRYVGTTVLQSGNQRQFLDKPWIAVDVPRARAGTCTIKATEPGAPGGIVTQLVPAGNVYMVWSDFLGPSRSVAVILFSRSTDCGATWSIPIRLSGFLPLNQGATIAVDPTSGYVYVAWRTFASAASSKHTDEDDEDDEDELPTKDGIVVTRSTDGGRRFSKPTPIVTLPAFNAAQLNNSTSFFDESTLPTNGGGPEMRTLAFPSMAVDGCGQVYVAWSQRDPQSMGDARIMMSTSTDGRNWSAPFRVDNGAISDDNGDNFTRGNQFMPSLTFAGGRLMALYYDLHLDHTIGSFSPAYTSFSADGFPVPDNLGRLVLEQRLSVGIPEPVPVFGPFVNDAGLQTMRHVLDLRVAQFTPVAAGGSCPSGAVNFTTARVSQYRFGTRGDGTSEIQQLEVNPPNLPMFEGGLAPFLGDYVEIAGSNFKQTGNSWSFDTAAATAPVHIAAWTDNRDVQPPAPNAQGLVDWTKYTPVDLSGSQQSVFDPTQMRPACDPTATASRNQNIYSSRITQGLVVGSPQTSKPLSTALQRAFVILVQNFTEVERSFRLSIANQPSLANGSADPNGFASFVATTNPPPAPPFAPTTSIDVTVGPHNGVTRPLFGLSSDPTASITVDVQEITAPQGNIVANGLSSFVVLNADGTVPGLINPDGAPSNTSILGVEVYNPNVSNPNVSNPNVSNPNVSNPNVSNPNVSNPNVSNPNVSNQSFATTLASGVAIPNVSNPNVSNPNVSNPNVSNPNVSNPNVSNTSLTTNGPVTDANYAVTNNGNTSASYHVALVSAQPVTSPLQLLVNKIYATPVAVGCLLGLQQANVLLANVNNVPIQTVASFNPTDTAITNSSLSNATFSLAPGEQGLLTLRGAITSDAMRAIANGQLAPVVTSQAANTDTNTVPFSVPGGGPAGGLFVLTGLPDAVSGSPYNMQVPYIGGKAPFAWSITAGTLPSTSDGGHLALNAATGVISGTPGCLPGELCLSPAIVPFTIQVTDAVGNVASQQMSIRVAQLLLVNTISPLANANQGTNYGPVNLQTNGGGIPPYSWTPVAGIDGMALDSNGVLSGVPTNTGSFTFTSTVTDSGSPPQVASKSITVDVVPSTPGPPAGGSNLLFDNFNFATVTQQAGGPPNPTTFVLASPTHITQVADYHWNNGTGAAPGTIGIQEVGVVEGGFFGSFNAVGASGQNNTPNAAWVATPNITLPAGTFSIVDSGAGTWSYNGTSFNSSEQLNCGFTRVWGYALNVSALTFVTQPGNATASPQLLPPFQVKATDSSGAALPFFAITIKLGSGAGNLSGTLTQTTGATGVATFNDLAIDTTGTGFTLTASVGNVNVTSNAFSVSPQPATNAAVSTASNSVVVNWTASTTPGVVGYGIYRAIQVGTGPISSFTQVGATDSATVSFTDPGALGTCPPTTYYYYVVAVGPGSVQSTPSTQASSGPLGGC